ncbi:MAG TPA: ATP-binding protein [Thermodesulfobacteriota bacterium]|nr:ATP-binding protein [Thermodesulfobacteriota bacterium]
MNLSILKAIFASMEQGVVFIDDRNRVAYCNPAAEKIRKIKLGRVLDRSILDFHPRKVHPKVLQVIQDLKSAKVEGHHRMNVQMVKGKFYDNTYTAVWGPKNKYWGTIVVSKEITERKKTEDQLKEALKKLETANEELTRLNQMKDDFLSTVSHELKTPMISVMGYLGLILKEKVGSLTEQQRKFLEISFKNLLKLEKNIDNLLDLAEMGIQKESWIFEPVDLVKVIEFSCSTVEPLAKEHEIRLEAQVPSEPVKIAGAEDKLNQLFDNLFTNAIKYNRQGGRIRVNLEADPESVFVRVADTGVGISHQSLQEVFTRHFQEKTKPLGNAKGLGIGLSLVQEIVNLHQGKIEIESELGRGTTFTVMFPRIQQNKFGAFRSELVEKH